MLGYEVRLPVFEGPLDLLLHLIEKQELDITTVSLAQVTDQYLDYISHLEEKQVANLVDFLVVASKLLLIKSRLLLPSPPATTDEGEEGDVGEDLVRQLTEYRKFKQLAAFLAERSKQNLHAYVRVGPAVVVETARELDATDVSLTALVEAVKRALQVVPPQPPVSQVIPPITISIHDKISQIKASLKQRGEMTFHELVADVQTRIEVIVTFLAMLELIKSGFLFIRQEKLFGEIFLRYRPEGRKPIEKTSEPGMSEEPERTPGPPLENQRHADQGQ